MSVLRADARFIPLADEVVQTVVTSPPYWGLRDYGIKDGIGLEDSPEAWVEQMVQVFREVRRVLRSDGTVWLNVGDAYAASRPYQVTDNKHRDVGNTRGMQVPSGLKPKDLIGLPWRLVFALQADGWWLRSDIVWSKPNPMPESVSDRPTKAHEYVFLLTKSPRYFYDADAVREDPAPYERKGGKAPYVANGEVTHGLGSRSLHQMASAGRNIRSVWDIATQPFPEAHFATFPESLVLPCIRAGTSEKGACGECGAPWERVVESQRTKNGEPVEDAGGWCDPTDPFRIPADGEGHWRWRTERTTTGWQPTCECDDLFAPAPCLVLDPFCGSGTTGVVARKLGRRFVGLDLSEDYCTMARRRIRSEGRVQTKGSMKKLDPDRYEEASLL